MLKREVQRILVEAALRAWEGYLDTWIEKYGQQGLDLLVEEDRDAIEHLQRTRPDLMAWIPRVKRIVSGRDWDVDSFTERLCEYLRRKGLRVTTKHEKWIRREMERVKQFLSEGD